LHATGKFEVIWLEIRIIIQVFASNQVKYRGELPKEAGQYKLLKTFQAILLREEARTRKITAFERINGVACGLKCWAGRLGICMLSTEQSYPCVGTGIVEKYRNAGKMTRGSLVALHQLFCISLPGRYRGRSG
jgi:hypothetical protein